MMLTCIVQMQTKSSQRNLSGAVLAEMVMVLLIVSLFTTFAMFSVAAAMTRESFKSRAYDLVQMFQMAEDSAAQSGVRYEVVIDFTKNSYLLREIKTGLVAVEDIAEEEIIASGEFNEKFKIYYVMFDDGEWTSDSPALFRVGKNGWQYGGKVVVSDSDDNLYSIVINRLARATDIVPGDVELTMPKSQEEMGF